MPLFYVSMSTKTSGDFVGAVLVNRETIEAAVDAAGRIALKGSPGLQPEPFETYVASGAAILLDVLAGPVPAGGPPVPHDAIERLLSLDDLHRIYGPEEIAHILA